MKILVAEDNTVTRRLLKRIFERLGHAVTTAKDGQEAWQRFQEMDVRLVISDWMMPQMDGLDLCRHIRAAAGRQYIYIVILTAKDQKEDLIEVFQAGADDYITKPFDPEELRASLTKCKRIADLEERYRSLEQTLIESRNKLRIVFDSLQEEIVAVDAQNRIVSANQAFLGDVHNGFERVIGRPFDQPQHADTAWICPEIRRLVADVFGNRSPRQIHLEIQDGTRGRIYKQINGLPVKDKSGDVIQVVVVSKDITEDRRKTAKIENLNRELRLTSEQVGKKNRELQDALHQIRETQAQILQAEKMASIGQLAAGVAHEINNPAGYVSSNLKTLAKYQEAINRLIDHYRALQTDVRSETADRCSGPGLLARLEQIETLEKGIDLEYVRSDTKALLDESREGMERIRKIVLDLKEFAHPGQDRMKPADINRGLASTLNVVWNEFKHKARVIKDFGDLPEISCFPQQLNQVFLNILLNAAQAIEDKGEIRIKTRMDGQYAEVKIQDNGEGIAEENLSRVFDPFFTTKEVGEGTGLGMNIAYNIVKKHNGSISVESVRGEGTTFTVRIPAA